MDGSKISVSHIYLDLQDMQESLQIYDVSTRKIKTLLKEHAVLPVLSIFDMNMFVLDHFWLRYACLGAGYCEASTAELQAARESHPRTCLAGWTPFFCVPMVKEGGRDLHLDTRVKKPAD